MPYGLARPESHSEVPAVVTRSPSAESGLTGKDLAESDFTFPRLPPQLTIQNTTPELKVVTTASCQGLLFSLWSLLIPKVAEGTFLNFSHFHYMNKLQLCSGQGPSHRSEGGCFLCLLL